MIFLVDLDGVVVDMEAGLNERLLNAGITPVQAISSYDFVGDYTPKEIEHIKAIMTTPGFFRHLPIYPGAADGVCRMLHYGKVFFVTSWMPSAPHSAAEKIAWVRENFGDVWEKYVILTQDKTTVWGDVLLDDKPIISGVGPRVWQRWVYDQPYNTEVDALRVTWDTLEDVLWSM